MSFPDLTTDDIDVLEAIATTRAIRRYRDEPVPDEVLRAVCFAATRAPSGSNRQPFRLLVLTDGPKATAAKEVIGRGARAIWSAKYRNDGYDSGSGANDDSPKARMARVMQRFVDRFEAVPALILPLLINPAPPEFRDGASVFPACQNLLLAARALGYGGVITGWHLAVEAELREVLDLPDDAHIAAAITLGRPEGAHGPVRRLPLSEFVSIDTFGEAPDWAIDPAGTRHTVAGPPRQI